MSNVHSDDSNLKTSNINISRLESGDDGVLNDIKPSRIGVSRLESDDDDILNDISNLRLLSDSKHFNQIIGSSPPCVTSDGARNIPSRNTQFAKLTPSLPPFSPTRGIKWDTAANYEDFPKLDLQQPISPILSHPRMSSPIRSDNGMSLESLILKQPTSSSAPFTHAGSFMNSDPNSYTGSNDLAFQPSQIDMNSTLAFPPRQTPNPQAEIEMLKRQLEIATRKIDRIQNQFGQQGSASDASEYSQSRGFRDSSAAIWNDQAVPTLEQLERKDPYDAFAYSGAPMARSFSPGTYQPSSNIWNNTQNESSKGRSRFDKWYNTGNQTIGNSGIYNLKSSEAAFPEPEPWSGPEVANPGIYESSFRTGGFTPKPKVPEAESHDNGFSQDVSCGHALLFNQHDLPFTDVLSHQVLQ